MRLAERLVIAFSFAVLAVAAIVDLQVVLHPFPLDLFEPAVVFFTRALSLRLNPYTLDHLPEYGYVYAPLYNLAAAPLTAGLTATASMQVHRALSAVLICATLGVLWTAMRRAGVTAVLAAPAIALLAVQMVTTQIAIARPDSLGLLMYVAGLALLWRVPSRRNVFAALALGGASFWTKQYFVLLVPVICAFEFMFVSKRLGLLLAACTAATTAGIYAASMWLAPFLWLQIVRIYLYPPVFVLTNFYRYYEMRLFLHNNVGVLLAAALVASTLLPALVLMKSWRLKIDTLDAPLIVGAPAHSLEFSLVVSAVAYSWLAGEPGNSFVYGVSLFTPILVVWTVVRAPRHGWRKAAVATLLLGNLVLCATDRLRRPPSIVEWQQVSAAVANRRNVLHAPALATIVADSGLRVWDTGHTSGLWWIGEYERGAAGAAARERWNEYTRSVQSGVERCEFDLVILTPGVPSPLYGPELFDLVKRHYQQRRSWKLPPQLVEYDEWLPDTARCPTR